MELNFRWMILPKKKKKIFRRLMSTFFFGFSTVNPNLQAQMLCKSVHPSSLSCFRRTASLIWASQNSDTVGWILPCVNQWLGAYTSRQTALWRRLTIYFYAFNFFLKTTVLSFLKKNISSLFKDNFLFFIYI